MGSFLFGPVFFGEAKKMGGNCALIMEIVEYKIPGAGRCADAKKKCQKGGRESGRKRGEVITTAVRQQERRKNIRKEEGK